MKFLGLCNFCKIIQHQENLRKPQYQEMDKIARYSKIHEIMGTRSWA